MSSTLTAARAPASAHQQGLHTLYAELRVHMLRFLISCNLIHEAANVLAARSIARTL